LTEQIALCLLQEHTSNGGERSGVSVDRQYHTQRYAVKCDDEWRWDRGDF